LTEDIYLYNDFSSYALLIVSIVFSLVSIFYYARIMAYLFIGNDFMVTVNTDEFTKLISNRDNQSASVQAAYDNPALSKKLEYEASFVRTQWIWVALLFG
jgi:hypothetical protein